MPPKKQLRNQSKLLLVVVAVLVAIAVWAFGDSLTAENFATYEAKLHAYRAEHPQFIYVAAFLLYVAVAGAALPGAAAVSMLYGWFFGFWRAFVLISFSSTAGATIAFLLSRYLFHDTIQAKFGDRLSTFNKSLETEGPFYLFSLRLIPIPFWLVNIVMGLTPIRTTTFWWVSQLGMIPGTALFVYFGSQLPDLATLSAEGPKSVLTLNRAIALVMLGVVPLALRWTLKTFRATKKAA